MTAVHPAPKPGRQNSQIRKRQVLRHRNALKSGGKNTGLLAGCPFQPAQPPPADTPQISGPLRPQKAATGMIRTAFDQGVELSAASSEFCAGVQEYPGTSSFFASSRYFTSSSTSVRGSRHDARWVKDPSRPQAQQNEERFSLGGAAHWPLRGGAAVASRAGERKTYWANPPAPQPRRSPRDADAGAVELIHGAMVVNVGQWRPAERWNTR